MSRSYIAGLALATIACLSQAQSRTALTARASDALLSRNWRDLHQAMIQ